MLAGWSVPIIILEATPARLELARVLADLGAALRRAGHRAAAREPLARALELAHRCGAAPLAEHARTKLHAAGARPQQPFPDRARSPHRKRAARGRARRPAGLSNAEIASRLFITVKTTEHHLAATYRKLDINSRHQLPGLLSAQDATHDQGKPVGAPSDAA